MRIRWDDAKSRSLKANPKRRTSFEEAKILLEDPDRDLGGGLQSHDPEQHFAIGFASNGQLITLVYEFRYDIHGLYYWLVTLWKATKYERKMVGH